VAWFKQFPRPLLVLIAVAIAVRAVVLLGYSTTVLTYYGGDSARYLRLPFTGHVGLFSDPAMPAGYPAFLNVIRSVTDALAVTIGIQHLLGVATGLLAYAAVRQTRAPVWIAVLPAAVVMLSGDQIFLEHAVLTETLWTLLLVAGLAAAVRAMATDRLDWFAFASILLAVSALVRQLSLVAPVIVAVCVLTLPGAAGRRVLRAAAVAVPAVLIVVVYTLVATAGSGRAGLGDLSGFSLYSRVGQFADCSKFTPPAGTRGLCERVPLDQRPGPYGYSYGADSPLVRAGLSASPEDAKVLGTFARAAIVHQPFAYLRTVGKDFLRYFDPQVDAGRAAIGASPEQMSFGERSPVQQGAAPSQLAQQLRARYSHVDPSTAGTGLVVLLGTYQAVFRVGGLALLVLILLTLAGWWRARDLARSGILVFGAVGAYLLVAPPALSSYDARYEVAPAELLAVSAALGLWALLVHRRAGRGLG
jgi:hypothetical protein